MKACPQIESTIYLGVAALVVKFTARAAFTVGNARIAEGDVCLAVRSLHREHRYFIVKFDASRQAWQCSCGFGQSCQDHIPAAKQYVERHDINVAQVKPQPSLPMPRNRIEKAENGLAVDVTAQPTPIDWKAVQKRDKARQKALRAEYWQGVREARAQDLASAAK